MARQFTKPLDLYKAQLAEFKALDKTRREGHRDLAVAALADARELTGGQMSPFETAGAFARGASPSLSTAIGRRRKLTARQLRGRGISGVPLLPINIQSGKLHDSFRLSPVSTGGRQTYDLTQFDPGGGIYQLLPGGTKTTVGRGFFAMLRQRWRARNKAFLDYYMEKSN